MSVLNPEYQNNEAGHIVVEMVHARPPEPGERCPVCDHRKPKPRTYTSPDTKRIVAALPPDRAEALTGALDALQAYVGADGESYPRGVILELLVIIGGQQREELRRYFEAAK